MKFFKRIFTLCLILSLFVGAICVPVIRALEIKEPGFDANVKSAVLMDANTGTVLYAKNENTALPPASVTKIMTLLLVFEGIEDEKISYNDMLTVSEYASSMGGSQVYLKQGESLSVDELIKCVLVASANDAAVVLAEAIAGSEEAFVSMMNEKAKELGMENTCFENVTGLDDSVEKHLTSAYDIALMSKELIKYDKVSEYATIWMDTIRDGEFGLTNTNRLVRYYKGITGLKTGSTSKAGFCMSATAKRDGMELICVVMGASSSEERNACVAKLLDFGFANYKVMSKNGEKIENIKISGGTKDYFVGEYESFTVLENKSSKELTKEITLYEDVCAPINKGDVIGKVEYYIDGECVSVKNIVSSETVDKITYLEYLGRVLSNFF